MTKMAMKSASLAPWWRGNRGEWYVLAQGGLFLLMAVGPRTASWLPAWSEVIAQASSILGVVLLIAGLVWVVAGAAQLGRSLTALPYPKDGGTLVDTGVFAYVRHPMYCGAIWAAAGWALCSQSLLMLSYAALLTVFFDLKASREERWLAAAFPGYDAYRARVRKLIPFLH